MSGEERALREVVNAIAAPALAEYVFPLCSAMIR
jgi:hypothetical protein